tara:strand:+ start:2084 stop:2266 length:183 start_codon:yes stop_codon:yes gene_type:complete
MLTKQIQYKGFVSSVKWDEGSFCWKGEIQSEQYPILFEGDWFDDLKSNFQDIVDEILRGY